MIEAIIIDFGNVIEFYPDSIQKIVTTKLSLNQNLRKISRELIHKSQTNSIEKEEFWHELSKKLNVNNEKLKKTWIEASMNYKVNTNILRQIKELKNNYKICLLSNLSNIYEDTKRDYHKYFHETLFSYKLGFRKPQNEIYEILQEKIKTPFKNCLYIDDQKDKIIKANKIGCKTFLYKINIR